MGLSANVVDVAYREAIIGAFRIHFEVGHRCPARRSVTVGSEQFEVIDINVENTIQIFRTAVAKKIE